MSEITGVTFPVPKKYIPRFFKDGKTVFIKPATVFKELRSGMKLVFYHLDSRQYITSPIDPRHYCPLNPNHPLKSKQSIYTSLCVTHNEPVYANPQNSFYFGF